MKSTSPALSFAALVLAAALSGCGGGGAATTPSTPPTTTGGGNGTSIGQLSDILQPASTVPVNVAPQSGGSLGPSVDIHDAATVKITTVNKISAQAKSQHAFAGSLRQAPSSTRRSANGSAVNSPLDMSYHTGPVLGRAVQHNVFFDCGPSCRSAQNLDPGRLLDDLGKDQYITLLYQYLVGPGVITVPPFNGRFVKGLGADVTGGLNPPLGPGYTNPSIGQFDIFNIVFAAANALNDPNGGFEHIYHVFLPPGVDTCFANPDGSSSNVCYSPDNFSTFDFCAYHGAFADQFGDIFLYTVQPDAGVPGCEPLTNLPQPNALPNGNDPADADYNTLSHETFETISDPLGSAWFNGLLGTELADQCVPFVNFVTLSGHPYELQSEYSDIHSECISANLTGAASTPQGASVKALH